MVEQGLSILPFIYLGAGVLFAATGSAFVICQVLIRSCRFFG